MILRDSIDGDVAVIELDGRLVYCDELQPFQERVRIYLERSIRRFVIDLKQVECTGSVGLGALIAAYTTVTKADGGFVLANVSEVQNLLALTRLYSVFEAYDSRTDALLAVHSIRPEHPVWVLNEV